MSSDMSIRATSLSPVQMTTPITSADTGDNRKSNHLKPEQAVASSINIQTMKDLNEAQMHGENVQISDQQVIRMIEKANKALQLRSTSFEFAVHKQTKQIMVKVFDKDSGEIIREIPPQKVLDMVAKMWELAGLLIDERL
jgi:flagellar protein FlaG